MGVIRAEIVARMRGAIDEGLSASRFIRDMKEIGLSYRRTDMLADWRLETKAKEKKGLLQFVRKDRYPSTKIMAALSPEASKEFLYKIKYERILKPGAKAEIGFINIMQDVPRTPEWLEREAWERSFKQSPPKPTEERRFIADTVFHKM